MRTSTTDHRPTSCLATRLAPNTIEINGVPVSLTKISETTDIALGYLSRIFSGKSTGSAKTIRSISEALGMPIEAFMDSLPGKKMTIPDNDLDSA